MGVEYFSDLLNKYSPECYFEVPLNKFAGTRIAIDLNNLVYQMYSASVKDLFRNGPPIDKPDPRDLKYKCVNYVLNRLQVLLSYSITPVCVVDGMPIPEKKKGQSYKKKEDREKYKKTLNLLEANLYSKDISEWETEEIEKYSRYYKSYFTVDYSIYDTLKEILSSCGFPILKTDDFRDQIKTADAEGLCACLCINGICFATMSTDSDVHVYGGNFAILSMSTKRSIIKGQPCVSHTVRVRSLERILEGLNMNFDSFQNICLLCSTDYNPKIKGIGYVKAYETVKRHPILASLPFSDDILNDLEIAKRIFCSTLKELIISPASYTINIELFNAHAREIFAIYNINHIDKMVELVMAITSRHV